MRQSERRARAPCTLWERVESKWKRAGKEEKENNKPVVGESEREAMSSGNLGVCEGWLRCVVRGEGGRKGELGANR